MEPGIEETHDKPKARKNTHPNTNQPTEKKKNKTNKHRMCPVSEPGSKISTQVKHMN